MKIRAPRTLSRRPRRTGLVASLAVLILSAFPACGPGEEPGDAADESILEAEATPAAGETPGAEAAPPPPRGPGLSVDAQTETHKMMKEDLDLERHASDGGGRAWIHSIARADGSPGALRSGDTARFEVIYEAGPLGIDVGGEVHFQVSPFWQWDTPQNRNPRAYGYTEARTDAEGVELQSVWGGGDLLAIGIAGRRLEPGEQVVITYGANPKGAKIDPFAEREERIWISVDGNADGVRQFIEDSPRFDIAAGEADFLYAVVPTTLQPGEAFELLVAILDRHGNAGVEVTGVANITVPEGLELPSRVEFQRQDRGRKRVAGVATKAGVYRLLVEFSAARGRQRIERRASTNPMIVEPGIPRLRWGDVHGHSNLSDGTGTPEDYFAYARDYAGLDFVALTDHDHWGLRFIDQHPDMWERIKRAVKANNQPGLFTTILGYEWTSWLHGHRHVLYFKDEGEIYSSVDDRYENPRQLWDALEGQKAMTFAHHSAGGPISTNWGYFPDPVLEPLTEIVSVHGVSEDFESPGVIYNAVRGNFVRDALLAGYTFGFIGSGDSHDGHPGLAHISNDGGSGLAAVFSEELDRDSLLEAMRARRTFATNGARSYIAVSIDGVGMGGTLPAWQEGDPDMQTLQIRVVGEGRIDRIDVVRSGVLSTVELGNAMQWTVKREIPRLRPGEFHYVRVIETSGAMAWSSPIFASR